MYEMGEIARGRIVYMAVVVCIPIYAALVSIYLAWINFNPSMYN